MLDDMEAVESLTCEATAPAGRMTRGAPSDERVESVDEAAESVDGAGPMLSCAFAESVNTLPDAVESAVLCPACWLLGPQAVSTDTRMTNATGRSIGASARVKRKAALRTRSTG